MLRCLRAAENIFRQDEIDAVVSFLKAQGEPTYQEEILEEPEEGGTGSAIMDAMLGVSSGDGDDDL